MAALQSEEPMEVYAMDGAAPVYRYRCFWKQASRNKEIVQEKPVFGGGIAFVSN